MNVLDNITSIANLNIERNKLIQELVESKKVSLRGCQLEKAYFIDGCIEKNNELYSKDGDKLGIKIKNTYYLLKEINRPFGIMYFASKEEGRFIGVPFLRG